MWECARAERAGRTATALVSTWRASAGSSPAARLLPTPGRARHRPPSYVCQSHSAPPATSACPTPPLPQVFIRERLNGYYGVSVFTVANTLASLPFIALIAVVSSCCCYWIAHLRYDAGAFWYFVLNLFMSLTVVESLVGGGHGVNLGNTLCAGLGLKRTLLGREALLVS